VTRLVCTLREALYAFNVSRRFFNRLADVAFLTVVGCTAPPETTETSQDLSSYDRAVMKQEHHAERDRLGRMGGENTFYGRKVDWQ